MKNSENCKYEVKIVVGHKIDGKPIRKSFYGKSKREAKQKATDYLIEHGQDSSPENITFQQLFDMYNEERQKFIRDNSAAHYESIGKRYLDEFGSLKIGDITRRSVTRFADSLADKYSQNYTTQIIASMSSVFKFAIENQLIASNPCAGVKFKSQKEKRERRVYTEEEADEILNLTVMRPDGMSAHIMLSYGTTISETLGIQYGDIDFEAGTIAINRSVTKTRGKVNVTEPKNKHRKRTIGVSRRTLDYIKANHNPEFLYLINDGINKDLPYDPSKWRWQVYKKFMEAAQAVMKFKGLDIPTLNPHELRHTRATIWVEKGVNLFAIAEEMGWSDLDMLRKVYGHPDILKLKGMLGIE